MAEKTHVSARLDSDAIERINSMPGSTFTEKMEAALKSPPGSSGFDLVNELDGVPIPGYELFSPGSRASEQLEFAMAASAAGLSIKDYMTPELLAQNLLEAAVNVSTLQTRTEQVPFIDNTIRAMMILAEFYAMEGDVWSALTVPIEVGLQDFDFTTGDEGAIREARNYLEELDIHDRIAQIFLNRQVYGQAYVFEEGSDNGAPTDLILPNPKVISVSQGTPMSPVRYGYGVQNKDDAMELSSNLPSFFNVYSAPDWNEAEPTYGAFQLKPERVKRFTTLKYDHALYAIPPLSRATRALDSRRYLEDMARATIEGVRNQLWLFTLENPMAGEIPVLNGKLSANRGARTGYLVWRSGLNVEQFVPGSIDNLLGNDTYWEYTLRVYRALGISLRFVSGENPNRQGSSDAETDVKIGLNRMMYSRRSLRKYVQSLVDRAVGAGKSPATSRTNSVPQIRFKDIELMIAARIKDMLAPLMDRGIPSPRSVYALAGLDYDAEKRQHEEDKDFREKYLMPYTAFAQAGPKSLTEEVNSGRPGGVIEKKPRAEKSNESSAKIFASILGDYSDSIEDIWNDLESVAADPNATVEEKRNKASAFILMLIALGAQYRRMAYADGYASNGGEDGMDEQRIQDVIAWDMANADNFEKELLSRIDAGEDISSLRFRALLYASQGHKMAYTAGVFQAKMEQGWTHWRRLLRPAASASGPCSVCIADSRNIHPITEPFFDHPNGVCGMVYLMFMHGLTDGATTTVHIPPIEVEEV